MKEPEEIAVIGGLGKMGRGIALMILLDRAWNSPEISNHFRLRLIDVNLAESASVRDYFRHQLRLSAEKGIIKLRERFKTRSRLVSNEEMIEAFIQETMDNLDISSHLAAAHRATLIFEAAFEEVEFKVDLFKRLKEEVPREARFFTNTSSIPIHVLNEKSGLEGRIIGFHFYNPPAIQPLLEIIPLDQGGDPNLTSLAEELAQRFKKTVVFSRDVAGFIGNGHFIREIALAFELLETLKAKEGETKALYTLDRITQNWLLRPMGIFQLLDYVGLDVVDKIVKVMDRYGSLSCTLPKLEIALKNGLKGGQNPDGSQRNGIFLYEKGQPTQVFNFDSGSYEPVADLSYLGSKPKDLTWHKLQKNPSRSKEIALYFDLLFKEESVGASLSKYWVEKSDRFMQELVEKGIASDKGQVAKVLKLGFYHLYTPDEVLRDLSAT